QSIGQTDVISVHPCDVGSLHEVTGAIDGFGGSRVALVDHLHAPASSCVFVQDLRAAVGRAVIHDDDGKLLHRLRHEAVERSGQEGLAVEDGHHARPLRHGTSGGGPARPRPRGEAAGTPWRGSGGRVGTPTTEPTWLTASWKGEPPPACAPPPTARPRPRARAARSDCREGGEGCSSFVRMGEIRLPGMGAWAAATTEYLLP